MQQDYFTLKNKTLRCNEPANIDRSVDTNTLALFHRPYYTEDQIPKNHKFHAATVKHKATYWGKNIIVSGCEIDGRGCAEALKISFGYNIKIENCIIHGGYEEWRNGVWCHWEDANNHYVNLSPMAVS